jgi:hypothetical protein
MPRNCSKNLSLSGIGWLVGLRSALADLTPSKSKGARSASTTLQPTSHPKTRSKTKTKVKVKVKVKVKTITGTGAAKGAG